MFTIKLPSSVRWDHPIQPLNWFQRVVRRFKRRKRANMAKIRFDRVRRKA